MIAHWPQTTNNYLKILWLWFKAATAGAMLRVTSVLVLAAAVQSTLAAVQPSDLNYEAQFEDVIEEFDDPGPLTGSNSLED